MGLPPLKYRDVKTNKIYKVNASNLKDYIKEYKKIKNDTNCILIREIKNEWFCNQLNLI